MSTVLITGGAGNLGRTLARALREKGRLLHIFDLPSCNFSFFDGWENVRIFKGDILKPESMTQALDGVEWVYHLAAILPPASEQNRDLTFRVNLEGTRNLLDACASEAKPKKIVFASSISVYGDTSVETESIRVGQPVAPYNWYAESKAEGERLLFASGLPYVNLRVSGIVIPAFLNPPEPWPFTPGQRIEMVTLSDLVSAMVSLLDVDEVLNRTLNIAGGKSWQVTGEAYVRKWGEIMEIPLDEMSFQAMPGYLNWFDTELSERCLGYQLTSLADFFDQLSIAVQEALA